MCSLWQSLSNGTINFERVTLTVTFDLLFKNFNITPANLHNVLRGPSWLCQYSSFMLLGSNDWDITFLSCLIICLFMLEVQFLCPRIEWLGAYCFCPVCLFVCLPVVNFNIRYNFWAVRDRSFICGMHTQLMMPFQMSLRSMNLWTWLWPLC